MSTDEVDYDDDWVEDDWMGDNGTYATYTYLLLPRKWEKTTSSAYYLLSGVATEIIYNINSVNWAD